MADAPTLYLDEMPGERRLVLMRGERPHRLLVSRDSDDPARQPGARVVGRVEQLVPSLKGAFVRIGTGEADAFLPLRGGARVVEGQALKLQVTAAARSGKGPVVRVLGPAEGPPRLIAPAPDLVQRLRVLEPDLPAGLSPVTGLDAVRASLAAEEEALADHHAPGGLDMSVERTRALVAVDVDLAPGSRLSRQGANLRAIAEAARLIALKGWGGLVAIDLAGTGLDGEAIARAARNAFASPEVVIGPVNRFGVLMVSLPWSETPIEERLAPTAETRALNALRQLNLALLSDTRAARITLRAGAGIADLLATPVALLGPRAHLVPDSSLAACAHHVETP
ncbi:MAG: RNA-binding protein [Brevundimonas sp.]|uniref:RNA-binding protein n=1 Tax=Brevundimonas sp. TaxID=1871086 RepID=UPI003918C7A4